VLFPLPLPAVPNRIKLVQAGAVTVTLDGFHANGVADKFEGANPALDVSTSSAL